MGNFYKTVGAILLCVLFLENCGFDIQESDAVFKWVREGNELTYQLTTSKFKIKNYSVLSIVKDFGARDNLIFHEKPRDVLNDPFQNRILLDMFSHVYVVQDGLYTTRCFKCGVNPCLSVKSYLKVPTRPFKYQRIPDYLCGDNVYTYDVVLGLDSLIKVPLGEFNTFVILDSMSRTVKFWNEEAGLIRIDKFDEISSDTIKFELEKVNY